MPEGMQATAQLRRKLSRSIPDITINFEWSGEEHCPSSFSTNDFTHNIHTLSNIGYAADVEQNKIFKACFHRFHKVCDPFRLRKVEKNPKNRNFSHW